MLPNRRMSEDEVCPVRDELLGELFRADENRVSDLIAIVTPERLALYCYRRSHLHTTGLAIAGSCNQDDLVRSGRTRRRLSLRNIQRSSVAARFNCAARTRCGCAAGQCFIATSIVGGEHCIALAMALLIPRPS
jgi:hypothetical protein